jgi:hypothetical protein
MSDIAARLRAWRELHLTRLGGLMDEAADEIERLRLADAEREAIAYYIGTGGPDAVDATLRGLLERLK